MSASRPRALCCDFCARPRSDVAFLFKSTIGGIPSCICDECVDGMAAALDAHDDVVGAGCGDPVTHRQILHRPATDAELAAQRVSWARGQVALGLDRDEAAARDRVRRET